ncbi:glutamic acid-rich protein-like [Engraulis encrasicolus]|uniref:glutamic acid-rich protein-like n=1 Tax=Engraulis encrasicolus TaxID=184585 RepID=UPI002FD53FE5
MNRLSQEARASLSPAAREGLQLVFSARAEEQEKRMQALRLVAEKQMRDMEELQASQQARRQAWKKEKADLVQVIDDARHEEFLKMSDEFTQVQADLNAAMEKLQKANGEREAVEKEKEEEKEVEEKQEEEEEEEEKEESKHILSQPEVPAAAEPDMMMTVEETGQAVTDTQKNLSHDDERDTDTSGILLAVAANRQRMLKDVKDQKWMEGENVISEVAGIPEDQVFEEQPQDSTPYPTDVEFHQLQVDMEFLRLEKQSLFDKIAARFMKKKEGVAAEFAKKQKEILAAHVKERRKQNEKMRKQMEKTHKAELKEQKKREAKIRKEAKKAAAAEEGRQTRCCFCFCF